MSFDSRVTRVERALVRRREQEQTRALFQGMPEHLRIAVTIGFALRLWREGRRPAAGTPAYAAGQSLMNWWESLPAWSGEGVA